MSREPKKSLLPDRRSVWTGLLSVPLVLASGFQGRAEALGGYRWRNRILIIRADGFGRIAVNQQKQILRADQSGLADRDMVVFTMTDSAIAPVFGKAPTSVNRGRFGALPGTGFEAVLIGKDGGIKGRWSTPVSRETLYGMIDAMPMRRREIRQRRG